MFNMPYIKGVLWTFPFLLVACGGESTNGNSSDATLNPANGNNNTPAQSLVHSDSIPASALKKTTLTGGISARAASLLHNVEALPPPQGVHFDIKDNDVSFYWPNVARAISYKVFKSENEKPDHNAASYEVVEAAFSDTGLESGRSYFYQFISTGDQSESIPSTTYKITVGSTNVDKQQVQQTYPQ